MNYGNKWFEFHNNKVYYIELGTEKRSYSQTVSVIVKKTPEWIIYEEGLLMTIPFLVM